MIRIRYVRDGADMKRLKISDVTSLDGDKDLLFCQFLDDFRHEPTSSCARLLADEPPTSNDRVFDVKLAAAAELLSHNAGIEPPTWITKPNYYLAEPYYMAPWVCAHNEKARRWFEETTPCEFSNRKLYCGEEPLRRC